MTTVRLSTVATILKLRMTLSNQYLKQDLFNGHVHWLEARITHHLRDHVGVRWSRAARSPPIDSTSGPINLLQHIPKKVPQRLEAKEFNEGYGMQAITSFAISKVISMFLVWHGASVAILPW